MRRLLPGIMLVVLSFAMCGCAQHKVKDVPIMGLSSYECYTCQGDYEVAVDVYSDAERTKETFYIDVNEKQYFPVNIIFKNNGEVSKVLSKNDVIVVDALGKEYRPVMSDQMCDEFEHNKIAYALLGFGIFSYASADEANTKMRKDWGDKELKENLIVSPGETKSGFVYLLFPDGPPQDAQLKLIVKDIDTNKKEDVVVRM